MTWSLRILFLYLTIFFCSSANSTESFYRCTLLPIIIVNEKKTDHSLFLEVEDYLKKTNWCNYQSSPTIISILNTYSDNLNDYLQNKNVLKVIASKTKSGSIIRIRLEAYPAHTNILMDVLADNGESLVFSEQINLKKSSPAIIINVLKNWINLYRKNIPYKGIVKGIIGNQFTFETKEPEAFCNGCLINIERSLSTIKISKANSPVVRFKTEKITEAKIVDITNDQIQAVVLDDRSKNQIRLQDWITPIKNSSNVSITHMKSTLKPQEDYAQLGTIRFFLKSNKASVSQSGSTLNEMDATLHGFKIEVENWLTRNYWFGLDVSKNFGNYKTSSGSIFGSENKTNNTTTQFKVGYRYLPRRDFFGPQLDLYTGFGNYDYGLRTNTVDKFTQVTFSGLLLGVKLSIPAGEDFRLCSKIDFLINSKYQERTPIYGSAQAISNFQISLGGEYAYTSKISFGVGISYLSNQANFNSPLIEYQFRDIALETGIIFIY